MRTMKLTAEGTTGIRSNLPGQYVVSVVGIPCF